MNYFFGTIKSKINGTPKDVYLPISKLRAFYYNPAYLLAHNNITISYYVKVNSLRLKSNVASKWSRKHLWGYHLYCCWILIVKRQMLNSWFMNKFDENAFHWN